MHAEPMEVVRPNAAVAERAAALGRPRRSLLRVERSVARRAMRDRRRAAARRGGVARRRRATCAETERAVERLRFVLALDDDLAPFHRAHRGDPLLGRVITARPKLRVLRKPEPFEALAWAIIEQLIDTSAAGNIAWAFTRATASRHPRGPWAAPPPRRVREPGGARGGRPRAHAGAHARPRARGRAGSRPGAATSAARRDPGRRRVDARAPEPVRARAATTCRWPRTSACATPTRASPACAPERQRGGVRGRCWTATRRGRAWRRCTWWRRDGEAARGGHESAACPTSPLKTDTTRCPTAAAVAAASSCPRSASGCGTASATTRRSRTSARSSAARSISASPTSTWPTTTARRYGSAEINFGRILREDLRPYRDELIISTKAGYDMWPGPYGEWGSRKYLLASLDQSLEPHGPGVRRHLLLAPLRPGHAAGGDDRRARHRGALRPRAVRRHLVLLGRAHARRRSRSPARSARRS